MVQQGPARASLNPVIASSQAQAEGGEGEEGEAVTVSQAWPYNDGKVLGCLQQWEMAFND